VQEKEDMEASIQDITSGFSESIVDSKVSSRQLDSATTF
jgi:hypothetical protein